MAAISRREFLDRSKKTGLTVAAGVTILGNAQSVWAAPENEKISLAMIGVRGRGNSLAQGFLSRDDCQITYVCDVDRKTGESRAKQFAERQGGKAPKAVSDFRRILEDGDVDILSIAAPNFWHAPATILACAAGKHVYVEKPGSHNPRESELMVAAAQRSKRKVQMGNQRRSAPAFREGIEKLRAGAIGELRYARCWYDNARKSIGRGQAAPVPDEAQ